MELNCSSSRLALIDAPGMLSLLDLEVRISEDEDRYVMLCHATTSPIILFHIMFIFKFKFLSIILDRFVLYYIAQDSVILCKIILSVIT